MKQNRIKTILSIIIFVLITIKELGSMVRQVISKLTKSHNCRDSENLLNFSEGTKIV